MTTAAGRLRAPAGDQGSGHQVRQPLRRGTLSRSALSSAGHPPRHAFMIT